MTREVSDLHRQARDFAANLTRTVRAVAGPECSEFRADVPEVADEATSTVVSIGQQPADGIVLTVRGVPLLTLTVSFECSWDSAREWLTVLKSSMRVHGPDEFSTEPLVRYEYERDMRSQLPGAHLHVHGVHKALTETMGSGGDGTRRSAARTVEGGKLPQLSALHFPLGGHRFRPCLEDVLAMLLEEFGVDVPGGDRPAAARALNEGRETWRRTQVAAAVRDAPDEAIRVLGDLGYDVVLREGKSEPTPRTARLRAL